MEAFDVVVIGAGPGGYVAAIRAAQLGMSVACVDAWVDGDKQPRLGGTCLNVGCIPSKALLESSHHYEFMQHEAAEHGIVAKGVSADVPAMIKRKAKVVNDLTQGIEMLFKKKKIAWHQGHGKLLANQQVQVQPHEGEAYTLQAKDVIIATGSTPRVLEAVPQDGKHIGDSSDALAWQEVPERLGVLGAGVIALELGSVWNRLGSEVTLFQPVSDFLPGADTMISRMAHRTFTKQGLSIHNDHHLVSVKVAKGKVHLVMKDAKGEQSQHVFDKLLVAAGRVPVTQGLADEGVGLALDEAGRVVVDADCRTNVERVWAVGDVVRGPMLAHKASEEGVAVAERIAGQKPHLNFDAVPFVVYTYPEVAWVGLSEQAAKDKGLQVRVGNFAMAASGRAKAIGSSAQGMCKFVADATTDRILGMHIVGPAASELIAIGVQAIETESSSEDLARTIFAHPTLSEVVHEAALDVDGRAIHAAK
jgi:dihydrolipoamide dehydrogenase